MSVRVVMSAPLDAEGSTVAWRLRSGKEAAASAGFRDAVGADGCMTSLAAQDAYQSSS